MRTYYFHSATLAAIALATGLCVTNAFADQIGDKAKALTISEWVKGAKDVNVTDGEKIYVVEFWATWCGPCKVSIPHLTELQKKYQDKGVVFVGVSSEKADTVKPFVEEQGEKMDYTVAVDKDRATSKDYMSAYGQNGIPCAFIVNKDGKVAWVGHPMSMEAPLQEIIDGKYDLDAAIAKDKLRATVTKYETTLKSNKEEADKLLAEVLGKVSSDKEMLMRLLNVAYGASDFDALDKVLAVYEKIDDQTAERAQTIRSSVKGARLMAEYKKNAESDKELAEKKLIDALKDDFDGICSMVEAFCQEDENNFELAEKLLKIAEKLDAVKAESARADFERIHAIASYVELAESDKADEKEFKAVSDKIYDLVKENITDHEEIANTAFELAMKLKKAPINPDLSLKLLDLAAENPDSAKARIPVDFFRAVVYFRAEDNENGDKFLETGLAAVQNESFRKNLEDFAKRYRKDKSE